MMGNYHVRFLGEEVMATSLPYPTIYPEAGIQEIMAHPTNKAGKS